MTSNLDSCKEATVREAARSMDEECSLRMIPCDAIKNEFVCAICLGILKKTVTSQECLHRFCRECIKASLKVGNQRCPTCRATLTELSLRADSVFDNLIEKLFPLTKNSEKSQSEKTAHPVKVSKETQEEQPQSIIFNATEIPQNVPQDGGKGESGKEKEESYVSNVSKDSNINQPHIEGSELNVTTPREEELSKTNAKRKKIIVKRFCTPERRSLRLEALKIESEKNAGETKYNQRLSEGCAHIFFLSLRLSPTNMKDIEDTCCCSTQVLNSVKEDSNSLDQNKSNSKKKEEVATQNDTDKGIIESNVDIVKEGGGKTYDIAKDERQKSSNNNNTDEFIDSYLSAENVSSKVPAITGTHIMHVKSDKLVRSEVVPLRRSERSAALIAQGNIWAQTASRRRFK